MNCRRKIRTYIRLAAIAQAFAPKRALPLIRAYNITMQHTKLAVVQSYGSRIEADLAMGELEDAGIQAMIRADTAGGMREHLAWSGAGFQILVRRKTQPWRATCSLHQLRATRALTRTSYLSRKHHRASPVFIENRPQCRGCQQSHFNSL